MTEISADQKLIKHYIDLNEQLLARESFYKAQYFQALVELRKANRGASRLSKRSDYFKEKYKETLEKLNDAIGNNIEIASATD